MENELKNNARAIGAKAQYETRKNIIRMLKNGKSGRETANLLGISEGYVSTVKKAYEKDGLQGLQIKKRGRKKGANLILTPEQEREIQRIIVDKTPEQMRLRECMWTRNNIRQLIMEIYKIDIKLSTLGYYLSRWGFSVQRPIKRAYKQDEKKIDKWLNTEFPGITERAKEEKAEIFFGDEANIQNTANYMKGYAPKGKTPVVNVEAQRFKINMLSAISKRGKLRFMLYKDNMNADKLIDFIRRLIRSADKKVFLVLDNLRVHHSKKVTEWLSDRKDKIEIFYLPPYAPEYNPDEYLNSDVKRNAGARTSPRSEKALEHNVRSRLNALQNQPTLVAKFFHSPSVKYAA